jgi:nitrate/TMAO reductase-like tetraheme cytochrome c subunit
MVYWHKLIMSSLLIPTFMARGFAMAMLVALFCFSSSRGNAIPLPELSKESKMCIDCHANETRGIYQEWGTSKHFRANVGCYECHQSETGKPGAMDHNGFTISIIVSPKDCSRCHPTEVQQFSESHHAKAAEILGSLDNYLADIVEGDTNFHGMSALSVSGCAQCHGSVVQANKDGSLKSTDWPNTGVGRINPDGSIGACSACHLRHAFSAEQARQPENCTRCHQGPDHPQKEIFEESKHGIAYAAHKKDLKLDNAKWVLGEDYTAAPTCATCHMSAVKPKDGDIMPVNHNVGLRISWNNRPQTSIRPEVADAKLGLEKMAKMEWKTRRAEMVKVCTVCHASGQVNNFYEQYDGVVDLYNSKFGQPGVNFMKLLSENKLITDTQFDEPIEWTWYELWHHEGRRARHGASMMGPDFTHWHGLYEVGKHWYTEFIPQLREIAAKNLHSDDPAKVEGAKKLDTAINELLTRPEHRWFTGKMLAEDMEKRKKAQEEFKQRYSK